MMAERPAREINIPASVIFVIKLKVISTSITKCVFSKFVHFVYVCSIHNVCVLIDKNLFVGSLFLLNDAKIMLYDEYCTILARLARHFYILERVMLCCQGINSSHCKKNNIRQFLILSKLNNYNDSRSS